MKRLILLALAAIAAVGIASAQQPVKEVVRQRKEIAKMSRIERNEFVVKAARKEAKAYEKAGWVIFERQLPLEKQMERAFAMRYESDKRLFPRYVMGEAICTGKSYEASEADAVEWAKLNMAEQVQTEICILIDNGLADNRLTVDEAAAITETVMAGREAISLSIGRVIPVMKCRRSQETGNNDVYICIAYGTEMAIEGTKKALRRELDKKGAALYERFDNITKAQ